MLPETFLKHINESKTNLFSRSLDISYKTDCEEEFTFGSIVKEIIDSFIYCS